LQINEVHTTVDSTINIKRHKKHANKRPPPATFHIKWINHFTMMMELAETGNIHFYTDPQKMPANLPLSSRIFTHSQYGHCHCITVHCGTTHQTFPTVEITKR